MTKINTELLNDSFKVACPILILFFKQKNHHDKAIQKHMFHSGDRLNLKLYPIPYVVHYFWPSSALCSK
jgi:hypothetical protein